VESNQSGSSSRELLGEGFVRRGIGGKCEPHEISGFPRGPAAAVCMTVRLSYPEFVCIRSVTVTDSVRS
jgi:hypothetical protein